MSKDSYNNSKDKELFEFYLEHGYFPEDLKESLKNKKNINHNKNNNIFLIVFSIQSQPL